ncbi:hypothetical protein G7075_10495 [Phycicoccus sp. HDW14]|uniref:hypothetical protein n=1 Tax=Phycicoccus sp. HDW14 TaxID=2714941 RepID=UPI00140AAFCF|nr:hypothetical protein [Phycicoccus sp. HDW14]QIM21454.1 hypothetical protein G7075_10495 [Phycicoccus sp. HDW14]
MTGRALTASALAAGLWVVGVASAGGVLAAVGWWTPWVAWPLAVLVAVGAAVLVRGLPAVRVAPAAGVAMVAVVLGFAVYAGVTHSEHVLPRRDAASNLQAAVSLATTHERVVPVDVAALGVGDALARGDVTLASAAFYQVGSASDPAVQPQFLMAPAVVYGFGVWAGGPSLAQLLPAVVMALGVLLVGLLGAHLAGSWWGVAAAGLTAVLFPVLNVARGTYSEQLALLTLFGGLLALTLVVGRDDDRATRRLALLGGVLVGGTALARVDALREVLLLLPFLAVGAALGQRWVRPVALGLVGSTVVAWALAVLLSYRYLGDIHASLLPLVAIAVVVLVGSLGGCGCGGVAVACGGRSSGAHRTSSPGSSCSRAWGSGAGRGG